MERNPSKEQLHAFRLNEDLIDSAAADTALLLRAINDLQGSAVDLMAALSECHVQKRLPERMDLQELLNALNCKVDVVVVAIENISKEADRRSK
jgi:hypothetical protein